MKKKEISKIKNLRFNIDIFSIVAALTVTAGGIITYQLTEPIKVETCTVMANNNKFSERPQRQIFTIEKSYSGMKLSHELEDRYSKIAEDYGIPKEIMLIIGDQESDGKWDNNGVISVTDDYGVFQINKFNHEEIFEEFGYTSDDLRYDPIKNAEAAAFLISRIMKHPKAESLDDIFGMYNGWTGWKDKEISINYVNGCNERLGCYFPEFEYQKSNSEKDNSQYLQK